MTWRRLGLFWDLLRVGFPVRIAFHEARRAVEITRRVRR